LQGEGQEFESPRLHHPRASWRKTDCLRRIGKPSELNTGARRPNELERIALC
jgi:hypothetical protein